MLSDPIAVARVAIESNPSGAAGLHVNVFHFAKRNGTVVQEADLQSLADELRNGAWFTNYRGLFYTDFFTTLMRCTAVAGDPLPGIIQAVSNTGSRVIDGDLLPSFVAARVSWKTGYAQRRYAGRTFFGGLRESDQADGISGNAYSVALATFLTEHMAKYEALNGSSTWVGVILSDPDRNLPLNNTPGKRLAQAAWIKSNYAYLQLTSLRRRRADVGA